MSNWWEKDEVVNSKSSIPSQGNWYEADEIVSDPSQTAVMDQPAPIRQTEPLTSDRFVNPMEMGVPNADQTDIIKQAIAAEVERYNKPDWKSEVPDEKEWYYDDESKQKNIKQWELDKPKREQRANEQHQMGMIGAGMGQLSHETARVESSEADYVKSGAKPVGFVENIKRSVSSSSWLKKLPFSPAAAGEMLGVHSAVQRLTDPESKFYENMGIDAGKGKVRDQRIVEEYFKALNEQSVRGKTFWAGVGDGLIDMPAWMAEFAATGGLAKLGSKTATQAAYKFMRRYVTTKAGKAVLLTASKVTGGIMTAALRSAQQPNRIIPDMLEGMTNDVDIVDGELVIGKEGDGALKSFLKAGVSNTIENWSEDMGSHIVKGLRKAPLTKQVYSKVDDILKSRYLSKNPGKTAVDFERILKSGGYDGLVGELGEEWFGGLTQAIAGTETYGAEQGNGIVKDTLARVEAAAIQLAKATPQMAVVLSVPGFALKGLSFLSPRDMPGKLNIKDQAVFKKVALTPEGAMEVAALSPVLAAQMSEKEEPSRKDLKRMGITGWNTEERKKFSGLLKDAIADQENFLNKQRQFEKLQEEVSYQQREAEQMSSADLREREAQGDTIAAQELAKREKFENNRPLAVQKYRQEHIEEEKQKSKGIKVEEPTPAVQTPEVKGNEVGIQDNAAQGNVGVSGAETKKPQSEAAENTLKATADTGISQATEPDTQKEVIGKNIPIEKQSQQENFTESYQDKVDFESTNKDLTTDDRMDIYKKHVETTGNAIVDELKKRTDVDEIYGEWGSPTSYYVKISNKDGDWIDIRLSDHDKGKAGISLKAESSTKENLELASYLINKEWGSNVATSQPIVTDQGDMSEKGDSADMNQISQVGKKVDDQKPLTQKVKEKSKGVKPKPLTIPKGIIPASVSDEDLQAMIDQVRSQPEKKTGKRGAIDKKRKSDLDKLTREQETREKEKASGISRKQKREKLRELEQEIKKTIHFQMEKEAHERKTDQIGTGLYYVPANLKSEVYHIIGKPNTKVGRQFWTKLQQMFTFDPNAGGTDWTKAVQSGLGMEYEGQYSTDGEMDISEFVRRVQSALENKPFENTLELLENSDNPDDVALSAQYKMWNEGGYTQKEIDEAVQNIYNAYEEYENERKSQEILSRVGGEAESIQVEEEDDLPDFISKKYGEESEPTAEVKQPEPKKKEIQKDLLGREIHDSKKSEPDSYLFDDDREEKKPEEEQKAAPQQEAEKIKPELSKKVGKLISDDEYKNGKGKLKYKSVDDLLSLNWNPELFNNPDNIIPELTRAFNDAKLGMKFDDIDGFEETQGPGGTDKNAAFDMWSPEKEHNQRDGSNKDGQTRQDGPPIPDRAVFTMIDLVELSKSLERGELPAVAKKLMAIHGRAKGMFSPKSKGRKIALKADIFIGPEITSGIVKKNKAENVAAQILFEILQRGVLQEKDIEIRITPTKKAGYVLITAYRIDPSYAPKILAHEIGHLVDYLPDNMLDRGNILGRIASMKDYMKEQIEGYPGGPSSISDKEKSRLKRLAKKMLSGTYEVEIDEEIRKVTGVTPEDILAIWNSTMDIREISPDLYKYIARLDRAAKKSIIMAAMKGNIPEELLKFAKVESVKTGKKIKKVIEKDASPENIEKQYRELFEAEVRKRGIVEKEVVEDELKALTKWWSPFNETADGGYTAYRYDSKELYAEAISVLLNNPAELEKRAPVFNRAFFGWLSAKPEMEENYHRIVDNIRSGNTVKDANERLRQGFRGSDDKAAKKYARIPLTNDAIIKSLRIAFVDKAAITKSVARKARKQGLITADLDPTIAIDRAVYSQSEHELYLDRMKRNIYRPLDKLNVDHYDFGLYLFHHRVISDRKFLGNPQGFTPETSKIALEELKEQYGDDRFAAMETARKNFWKIRKELVIDKAKQSGMYGPELLKVLVENEYYVTFDVVKYIDEKFGTGKGYGKQIHKQIGTLEDVRNPIDATVEKDLAIISSINWNNAKRATVDLLLKTQPELIEVAEKRWVNNHFELKDSKDSEKKLVMVLHNGEMLGYYVDKWHADIFLKENPPWVEAGTIMARAIGAPFRMLFTGIRPGFWGVNVVRDARRLLRNTPNATLRSMAVRYVKSITPAFKSTFGDPTDIVQEMLKANALISVADVGGLTSDKKTLERLKRMYSGTKDYKLKYANPLFYFHTLLRFGEAMERVPKIAAWEFLKEYHPEMSQAEREHIVRTQAGSPSFLTKGEMTWLTNNIFLFSNAAVQGWRSDIKAYADRPGDTGKKLLIHTLMPKALMWAFSSGALVALLKAMVGDDGDDDDKEIIAWAENMQKLYDNISEYDKTNYLCIPLGLTKEGKTVCLRMPFDENERFISGVFWKLLQSHNKGPKSLMQLFDYTAGQTPNLNPLITTTFSVMHYLSGRNPYDYFRQRNVVPETIWKAGGWEKHKFYMKHLANNLGVGIVKRFSESDMEGIKTELEVYLNAPFAGDILGRFVKVTDRGKSEILREVTEQEQKLRAREIAQIKKTITKQSKGEELTDEESTLLKENQSYVDSRLTKLQAVGSNNVYEKELFYTATQAERYAMQLKILEIEGPGYDLTPLIKKDILTKSKVFAKEESTRVELKEAAIWLKERNVKFNDVYKAYNGYLNTLKTQNKNERRALVMKRLRMYYSTSKSKGVK